MADYDLKSITADAAFADGNVLFGADDQSSATPVPYTSAGIKTWILANKPSAFATGESLALSGNISAAAWTTSGLRAKFAAASYTDTSSSGTVTNAYTDLFGASTILASSAVTYTNYYGAYFKVPVASTNVTMTNKSALGADSLSIGGAAQSTFALAVTGTVSISGNADFGGYVLATTQLIYNNASGSFRVNTAGVKLAANTPLSWTDTNGDSNATQDLFVHKDAANAIAHRNAANSQTVNWYDTYASATDYHRGALKTARATLSGVTGASVTATGIIPDGAVVVGVTTKVTTGLGTGGGTTGYQVGDGSDADRWGAITGTIAGTSSDNRDWTAGTIQAFTAASDIVITASGGNFDGTGVIYVSVQYLIGQSD